MEQQKKKRGPRPKPKSELKHDVRFFIKKKVLDKYGEENLLRPEVIADNER
jgi:hypothetical protein